MIYHGLKQSAESVIAELAQMAKDCPKDVLGNNARQWLIHCQDALGCFQRACEHGMKSETPPSVSDVVGIYQKDAAEQAQTRRPFDLAAALRGEKVVTRDGRLVMSLRWSSDDGAKCGIMGLIGGEWFYWFTDGRHCFATRTHELDLFMEGGV